MMPPYFVGEAVNGVGTVAREIAHYNAQSAWATLGKAYAANAPQVSLDLLKKIAEARQRKLNKAYALERGEAMRIRPVI